MPSKWKLRDKLRVLWLKEPARASSQGEVPSARLSGSGSTNGTVEADSSQEARTEDAAPSSTAHPESTQTRPPLPASSSTTRSGLGGLKLALSLAESALDGVPIPGAKGSVGALLRIIINIEKTSMNVDALKELEKHVQKLREEALIPLSALTKDDLPDDLKRDVETLQQDLQELGEVWTARMERTKLRRFIDATQDEADLKIFADGIRLAVERFQFSSIARGRLASVKLKKDIELLWVQLEGTETNAASRERTKLVHDFPRAHEASFSSGRMSGPSSCFAGTRVKILETIHTWIENLDNNKPRIFWLNGLAGIGKSTIARTVAEYADEKGILGGSFFFARGDQALSDPTLVFPTLAFQLAQFDLSFKSSIGKVLEAKPHYAYEAAPTQLSKLIIEPLSVSDSPVRRLVLVLDALDECRSEEKAAEILRLLLAHLHRLPFLLCVLLTSRPEHHIRRVFDEHVRDTLQPTHTRYILHDVEASVIQNDIRLFVRERLTTIPVELDVSVAQGWPKGADLEALVEKSGKLFVYAATATRFIGNDRVRDPERQLAIMLGARQATNAKPYAHLDQLYLQVLRNALPGDSDDELVRRLQWVLGCVVSLRDPLSVAALARFTKLQPQNVVNTLYHLHSVIIVPQSHNDSPRIYHPSFPDFISDPKRCTDETYAVVASILEKRLVLRCLELMTEHLRRDVASIQDYSLLNEEVPDLDERVNRALPPEVQYSCLFWASHLVRLEAGDGEVVRVLDTFMSSHLLHWFEAMSLLKKVPLAASSMQDAHLWASSTSNKHLTNLLYDGYRFILSHQVNIGKGALQVYRSALPFTPHDTLLYRTYEQEAGQSMHVLHGISQHWSPCLSTFHGQHDQMRCVAYSLDGKRFAVGYNDSTAAVYEAVVGDQMMELRHTDGGEIVSLAFWRDHTQLVTASNSLRSTISLWDLLSSTLVRELSGHVKVINCLSTRQKLPDLASASSDSTIRLWNVSTGECTSIFECPGSAVLCVAFVPDAENLLSTSQDGVVRIWDLSSLSELRAFQPHAEVARSIAVTSDGDRFALGLDNGNVKIFMLPLGNVETPVHTLKGHSDPITTVAFSPNGTHLASGGHDNRYMQIWETSSGKSLAELRGLTDGIAYSPDGTRIVSVSKDGTCRLWETGSFPAAIDPSDHKKWVTAVAFSDDGLLLGTGGGSKEPIVKVWDAISGHNAKTLHGHTLAVYALAFGSNNTRIASGGSDRTVRVWDVASGYELFVLSGHDNFIKSLSFSDDGRNILSRIDDSTFTWNLSSAMWSKPVSIVKERNKNASNEMSGYSKGYWFSMEGAHSVFMSKGHNGRTRHVGVVLEEFRITGFAFHSDRAVFTCTDGPVLILDVSRLKAEFI